MIAALGLSLVGCSNGGGSDDDKKPVSTSGLKVNFSEASYLATQFVSGTNRAETDAKQSLLAVMKDGSIASGSTLLSLENYADGSNLCSIREIYKNTKGVAEAKGTYIVFEWYNELKDKEGKDKPLGQIVFVRDDGQVFDIFNKDGDVKRLANSWHKEYSGKEYIKFDDNGNIFMFGLEGKTPTDNGTPVIYKWNPTTQNLQTFQLKGRNNVNFQLLDVTSSGEWIFTYATFGEMNGNNESDAGVYGFNTNGSGQPVVYYESSEKQKFHYPVKGLTVNNNKLLFYINGYFIPGREEAGLFVVPKTSEGYLAKNMKRYFSPLWNDLWMHVLSKVENKDIYKYEEAIKYELTVDKVKAANLEYTEILNYIKACCNNKDVDFTLDYFKDKATVHLEFTDGVQWDMPTEILKTNSSLKNEEALKFLFETPALNGNDDNRKEKGDSIFMNEFYLFCCGTAEKKEYKTSDIPLFLELFLSGSSTDVYTKPELTYMKSEYVKMDNFLFISNDEGTWAYNDYAVPDGKDKDGNDKYKNTHAKLSFIVDLEGYFSENAFPGELKDKEFYPSWDNIEHEKTDPWKKMPFAVNKNGIAAISKDQKTIYYTSKNVTKNLLENDENKNSISTIYSFSLDDETLIYNASKPNGGHIMVSINLATGEATKLPLTEQLETMIKLR